MTTHRSLARAALLVALLAALALAAACGGVRPYAATVGGDVITRADFTRELNALHDNGPLQRLAGGGGPQGEGEGAERESNPLGGTGRDGTFRADLAARWLSRLIVQDVADHEFARRHLRISAGDRGAAEQGLPQQFGGNVAVVRAFPAWFRARLVGRDARFIALQRALQGEQPTDKDALDYYRRHPEDFAQACVSHILVKTRPAAADLVDQLTKGGDFGALARARSQDPGSGQQGGSLGCGPLAQYVNAFKVAAYRQPLNEVSSPVRSQFGWHVILVTSRQLPAFDVVKSDVLSLLQRQAGQRLDEVITAGLRKGRVKVDPRYGTFQLSSQGAQVIPPAPPTVPDSPHPSRPSGPTPFPPGPPQG